MPLLNVTACACTSCALRACRVRSLARSSELICLDMLEAVVDGDLALLACFLQAGADPDLAGGDV